MVQVKLQEALEQDESFFVSDHSLIESLTLDVVLEDVFGLLFVDLADRLPCLDLGKKTPQHHLDGALVEVVEL